MLCYEAETLVNRQQAEIEKLHREVDGLEELVETKTALLTDANDSCLLIRADAVKEFAERLKTDLFDTEYHLDRYYRRSIDNLLKRNGV